MKRHFITITLSITSLILLIFPSSPLSAQAASVDLSAHMPPVKSQGSYGSCVGWATTYYYKTFQEKMEHGWDVGTTAHQFSPSFVWNQINGGQNQGTYFDDAFDVLLDSGSATWESMPYTHYATWPIRSQWENGMWYRAQDYSQLSISTVNALKAHLDSGDVLVVGVPVYSDYLSATGGNDVHDGPRGGYFRGGHAITIVGYDDSRSYTDINGVSRMGAFKFVNSWGSTWSGNGFSWFSNRFILNYTWEAWKMTDRIDYQPLAWARVNISHPKKSQLEYKIGTGSPADHPFEKFFFNNQGAANANISASHDLTDEIGYLPPDEDNRWYLWTRDTYADGSTGSLDLFTVVYDGQVYSAKDLPTNIPEGGSSITSYLSGEGGENSPPTQPTVTITPPSPGTAQNLLANASGSTDPDGDGVSYRYQWYKNGIAQPSSTSASLSKSETLKGDTWKCVVTPTDGLADGPSAEDEVTVINSPPILSSIGSQRVTENTEKRFKIYATDSDTGDQLSYSASNLPEGAHFDNATQIFSWTPTSNQLGIHSGIHFEVSDGETSDSENITITVVKKVVTTTPNICRQLRYNELIQAINRPTIFVHRACQKLPILSRRVFNQRNYRWNKIRKLTRSLVRQISTGRLLVYRNKTLLRAKGKGTVWIIQKQKRRYIKNSRVLRVIKRRLPVNRRHVLTIRRKELKKIPSDGKAWIALKADLNDYQEAIAKIHQSAAQLVTDTLYRIESGDGGEFAKPVEIAIKYDPADLPDGYDRSTIIGKAYDDDGNWIDLPTTIEANKHIAIVKTSKLNLLGLFAQAETIAAPIVPSTPINPQFNWILWGSGVIAIIVVGGLLGWLVRPRKKQEALDLS